jgi:hypothetical protein
MIVVGSLAGLIAGTAASLVSVRAVTASRRPVAEISEPAPTAEPPISPLEQQQRHLAEFAKAAPDPKWSEPAVVAIRDYLKAIAKQGARAHLLQVECRSRTCLAELQWDNLEQARADSRKLAMIFAPAISGCTSEIYLPPSDASPYRSSLTLTGCQ